MGDRRCGIEKRIEQMDDLAQNLRLMAAINASGMIGLEIQARDAVQLARAIEGRPAPAQNPPRLVTLPDRLRIEPAEPWTWVLVWLLAIEAEALLRAPAAALAGLLAMVLGGLRP